MKNRLCDLNDHLFAQLERLSDENLTPEQIETEVRRADAIVDVSDSIIRGADLQLKAVKILADHGDRFKAELGMISGKPAPASALNAPTESKAQSEFKAESDEG